MFKNASIGQKLYLACGLVALLLIGSTIKSAMNVRHGMLEEASKSIMDVVELGETTAASYFARAQAGEMSMEEARTGALAALRDMRFEGDNYYFVIDRDHTMVMHAIRDDLNGQSMVDTTDPTGNYLFRDMVNTATREGRGIVDYYWPKAGSDVPVLKRSSVGLYQPFDIIIGAGVYLDDVNARITGTIMTLALVNAAVIFLIFGGAYFLNRSIQRPVAKLCDAVDLLAKGDTEAELPEADGREVADLTASVRVLQESARERVRLQAEATQSQQDQMQRAEQIEILVREFDEAAQRAIGQFETAGAQLRTEASGLKENAEATSTGADTLDGAARTSSQSVEVVAAAAEELTAAISEINQQSLRSSQVSKEAVQQAEATRGDVQRLSEAAQKIDGIVQLIAGVTEQTNLLALNATIEAARAGEAGKGFAVVASEVKALADQTANATESIVAEIKAIQSATDQSVKSIEGIATVIDETYEIATAISAAMEEQRAAAAEISSSAQSAAEATSAVGSEVNQAKQRAASASQGAQALENASGQVGAEASSLKSTIERFLSGVRAA